MPGQTLDQLEGVVWGEPTYDSHLVTTCHRLRTKPVDEFSVEDLRIMIGQRIGLPHLVPLAVAALERDPLAEGDFYPGDLLASVIRAAEWLQANPEWLARVIRVTERASAELEGADRDLRQRLAEFLARARG
jgi:CDI immunity proteins